MRVTLVRYFSTITKVSVRDKGNWVARKCGASSKMLGVASIFPKWGGREGLG
jgi:hypothetical protein